MFVLHGQCADVHLGGHVQTGGYGQLGRSFGLLADYVISLEIINHNGEEVTVTKSSNSELFYAILGRSPVNLCILTHFTIAAQQDINHKGSRGLSRVFFYNTDTLTKLLNIMVNMSDKKDVLRNYDYCVTVLSNSNKLMGYISDVREWADVIIKSKS